MAHADNSEGDFGHAGGPQHGQGRQFGHGRRESRGSIGSLAGWGSSECGPCSRFGTCAAPLTFPPVLPPATLRRLKHRHAVVRPRQPDQRH
jgi:hypothetical protein